MNDTHGYVTSEWLNTALHEVANKEDSAPPPLAHYGKAIPYIGWFWREVDFDKRITLGDCGSFVGFMENNKWGYPEWKATETQSAEIREAAIRVASATPGKLRDELQALYDLIQSMREE